MIPTLVSIPYSPWSRRAALALDLEGITHERWTYTVGVSEPWLRARAGRWLGPITVPALLVPGGPPIFDSSAIARWASARGAAGLLTPDLEPKILPIVAIADRALAAGRLRATLRVAADDAAIREQIPASLRWLGPLGLPIGRGVARRIASKYADLVDGSPDAALARALDELARARGEREHFVGGRLTWADLAAASALGFVAPPDDGALGPRGLEAFGCPRLAREHEASIAWARGIEARAVAER